jgi:signal transduction histidine kinase
MVVEKMGGEITCNSELGKGTKIEFHINIGCNETDNGLGDIEHKEFN